MLHALGPQLREVHSRCLSPWFVSKLHGRRGCRVYQQLPHLAHGMQIGGELARLEGIISRAFPTGAPGMRQGCFWGVCVFPQAGPQGPLDRFREITNQYAFFHGSGSGAEEALQ